MDNSTDVTPGWHLVRLVIDGQPLTLHGLNPWDADWVRMDDAPLVVVAHPQHPQQRHEIRQYRLNGPDGPLFAAGEVSNNVWVFFVPAGS